MKLGGSARVAVKTILLLGNPQLYEKSEAVLPADWETLEAVIADLHDTLMDFRERYHIGRAIAAPQIGVMKRIIYMNTGKPVIFINPELLFPNEEIMEVWDDCMSFPNLLVRVRRFKRCTVHYEDRRGKRQVMHLEGDLSELIQHEYDHLDGILAVDRAITKRSFALKTAINQIKL